MRIISFVGPKGSGKDTAADLLKESKKAHGKISFAGPLKQICAKVFGVDLGILNDPVLKEKLFVDLKNFGKPIELTERLLRQVKKECAAMLEEYDPNTGLMRYNIDRVSVTGLAGQLMESPRQLLQVIGTEFIRDRIYKGWHVEAAFSDSALAKLTQSGTYCVTDTRFTNEYEFLKEKFQDDFICYYVERPEKEEILAKATHASELGVKEIRAIIGEKAVIKNDSTIEEFQEKLDKLIETVAVSPARRGSRFVFGTSKS